MQQTVRVYIPRDHNPQKPRPLNILHSVGNIKVNTPRKND